VGLSWECDRCSTKVSVDTGESRGKSGLPLETEMPENWFVMYVPGYYHQLCPKCTKQLRVIVRDFMVFPSAA